MTKSLSKQAFRSTHQAVPVLRKGFYAATLLFVLVFASMVVGGGSAAADTSSAIRFAGRDWIVKSGHSGPGPNHWSNDPKSVWVDDDGALHLKIRQIDGVWHSAEVHTTVCSIYGTHQFSVRGPIDDLDPNVVAALFLYEDDETEIDIEFSRWGDSGATENGQYVVQPYFNQGNRHQFAFDPAGAESTHAITWQPAYIEWKSMHGGSLIQQYRYDGDDIPRASACMRVHINHWLRQGLAPTNGQSSEIVIADARLPQTLFLPNIETDPTPTSTFTPTPTPTPVPKVIVQAASATRIRGKVSPETYCNDGYKIAVYAKTDIWYVQPFANGRRNIPIDSNCKWETSTHNWNQIAAFLVRADYDILITIPKTRNCPPLPLDPAADSRILAGACYP